MCAATAAAIATATVAVAGAAAGALSSKGGGGGSNTPVQTGLKGFPPASGMQNYTARMLALNAQAGTKPPNFEDWVSSGGKDTYADRWIKPDFTPTEARQLRMVDIFGNPIPGFDPTTQMDTGLTTEQKAFLGRERRRKRVTEPHGKEFATFPEEELSRLYDRQQNLQRIRAERGLNPQQEARLGNITRNLQRHVQNPMMGAKPSPEGPSGTGIMETIATGGVKK